MHRLPLLLAILCSVLLATPACAKPNERASQGEDPSPTLETASARSAVSTKTNAATEPTKIPPAQVADPNEACAKILVIAHDELDKDKDKDKAPVGRDRASAKNKAEALLARLRAGESFAKLVQDNSDDARTRAKKGGMGTFKRDAWPARYEVLLEPIFALQIGEHSGVLDTPFGFVVAERCAIDKVHSRHILIRYRGAKRANDEVTRSREEARAQATAVRAAIAGGQDFAQVAREKGEDGSSERGGDLGSIGRGMFAFPYEEAAWALQPGELSDVVETDFGFHIIERLAD